MSSSRYLQASNLAELPALANLNVRYPGNRTFTMNRRSWPTRLGGRWARRLARPPFTANRLRIGASAVCMSNQRNELVDLAKRGQHLDVTCVGFPNVLSATEFMR